MSKTVPVREFRTHLADLLDEVADRREQVTVTRHGRPAAVVVPVDEYEALEETAEILAESQAAHAQRPDHPRGCGGWWQAGNGSRPSEDRFCPGGRVRPDLECGGDGERARRVEGCDVTGIQLSDPHLGQG